MLRRPLVFAAITGLAALGGCRASLELTPSDAPTVLAQRTLEAPDPGARGPHGVRTFYYGSGTDRNRPEYRDSVTLVTPSVDGSKLVDLGPSADARNDYWGFTPEALPLNGRVWHPDGEGPFPLVLVVHGNHDMRDFSDPGYDYLGELLASRGFVLVSVDMNFINGGIRGENDARGWLLLEHLKAWRAFEDDPDHPLRGRVDWDRIALMGHSRGGEAAPVAASFNRLTRYPDDATLEFDYGFSIRSVVSIAPVDGQYLPTGRPNPVEDVSYLVFHGSHDGDVTSFHGLRIWDRVRLTPGSGHFKSAIYMYRANHGQWNTVWNAFDNGPRSARILDLRALVEPAEQRRFAELYVSAFLEATLRDDTRWLPMFRDHRVIGEWLPPTMYVTRLQDASFRALADFEEDIDVTTGSKAGVRLIGDSLATWKEERLTLRSQNRNNTSASQENQGVVLGWKEADDSTEAVPPARYSIELPDGLAGEWALDGESSFQLSLSATRAGADDDAPPVDLSIEFEDGSGRTVSVPLSDYGPVRRPLDIYISRRRDLEMSQRWELVLQTYVIPLRDAVDASPGFAPGDLRAVRLVFDRVPEGEVVVDEIGIARLDPAFWSARVR